MKDHKQRGFVTTEFLVAIAIAFGLTTVTFALTYTLSTIEVYQYVIFSTARAHAASNDSVESQQKAARQKYQQLTSSTGLKSLFSGNWFQVSKPNELEIRSGSTSGGSFEADYSGGQSKGHLQGVRGTFTARILEMRLPFLGSITPESGSFSTRVNAIMMREVSFAECVQFMKNRAEQIWKIEPGFGKFKNGASAPWEDNGC